MLVNVGVLFPEEKFDTLKENLKKNKMRVTHILSYMKTTYGTDALIQGASDFYDVNKEFYNYHPLREYRRFWFSFTPTNAPALVKELLPWMQALNKTCPKKYKFALHDYLFQLTLTLSERPDLVKEDPNV